MKILKTYAQFVNEASSASVQLLIDKLQSEASSAKMRTGGTADKLPWAMTFIVNGAAINKLQDDMAQGKFNGSEDIDGYKKQFFDTFEENRESHIQTALDFLVQNGLDPAAAEKLKEETKEAVEEAPKEPEVQSEPTPSAIPTPEPETQPAPIEDESIGFPEGTEWKRTPTETLIKEAQKLAAKRTPEQIFKNERMAKIYADELNEAWKLNQIKPDSLTVKKIKVVKSLAEKEFRTAFNHMRNLVRKYLV